MWSTLILAVLVAITAAAPSTSPTTSPTTYSLTNFLLVTTTSSDAGDSSKLPDVNATSLFDPMHQTDFYLRLIGPGYGSLPRFNLTQGTLHTFAQNLQDGFKVEQYNSTKVVAGKTLTFDPVPAGTGNLSLEDGYLLAVDGSVEGWTVCEGALGESVIYWQGTDKTCVKRYIQAVKDAPY